MKFDYRPLPLQFSSGGFQFQQLMRQGDVILLSKTQPGWRSKLFETVAVRKRPAEQICGCSYPPREILPSSEQWGRLGWSASGWTEALRRFETAIHRFKQGKHPRQTLINTAEVVSGADAHTGMARLVNTDGVKNDSFCSVGSGQRTDPSGAFLRNVEGSGF